jgi:hypothetical protein
MSYKKTSLNGMQSYQHGGGWKYGPTVYPDYGYYGGGPAYVMLGNPPTILATSGMGIEINGQGGGFDISRIWSLYLLPASVVLLGAWAAIKIYETVKTG